jgi:uncharacterized RDD family membrane protein YckC
MKRAGSPPDEPGLFDLPLAADEPPAPPRPSPRPPAAVVPAPGPAAALPLFPELPAPTRPAAAPPPRMADSPLGPRPAAGPPEERARHAGPAVPTRRPTAPAGLAARLGAGIFDLGVHALVVGAAWGGIVGLGLRPGGGAWLPLGLFLLVFSFLYTVVPLAFWGATPGMAAAGIVAQSRDGSPLSFEQAGRRWLGALLTALLAGLPLLAAWGGRASASDRLSSSRTARRPR